MPVAKWNESLDVFVVREGVSGVFQPSDEVDDRCDNVCTELSLPLSFDGPALAGVWKIPISVTGDGASNAEAMT